MQSFHFHLSTLTLLCLTLSSFHGVLVHGQQNFNFPTGKLSLDSLTSVKNGSVDSTGTLILDSSAGEAQAFYKSPVSLYDATSRSVLSFSTFFTFSANATSGNGTVAFVVIPDANESGGLAAARNTFTIEFNTSCGTGGFFNGGHAFPGRGGGWGGRGGGFGDGGLGGFQVLEYANNTSIAIQATSGFDGSNWQGQIPDGPYFCSQQPPADLTNPTFLYQVVLEYNATTDTVLVGSPSCGAALVLTTQFAAHDLSDVISKPVYVGFIVTGGGVFNLSQWNFTNNATTNSVTSLALSSTVDTTNSGVSDGGDNNGGGRHSHGLGKGYVIAFSVLGAAIGIGAVALMCCVCAARRRRRVTSARFVGKGVHRGTIPESAVVFDATKPPAPPAKVVLAERDTIPLYTHPNSTSTGAASWLQPVAPR